MSLVIQILFTPGTERTSFRTSYEGVELTGTAVDGARLDQTFHTHNPDLDYLAALSLARQHQLGEPELGNLALEFEANHPSYRWHYVRPLGVHLLRGPALDLLSFVLHDQL